ncbi:MAG TPA: antibiotic biosynthesis monooxygenase [Micromonosporaceae bacterium]|nr:antibiotic biosynthesis monooxygenase [Micromonosporaceae bacterium]
MLVVTRFTIGDADAAGQADFVARAQTALRVLAGCKGYLRGRLARSLDESTHWLLLTEWASVGAYRRALSSYDVKVHATPLLAQSADEPSAYEVLADADAGGEITVAISDRADAR